MDEIKTKKTHSLFPRPHGQMTRGAPHRISPLRDSQVALTKLGCLTLEMLPRGQDCSVQAEVWCGLMALASRQSLA